MPTARRTRTFAAPREAVWEVVRDPYHLPRWWPRAQRVESVGGDRWTLVLTTEKGRPVRADFRALESEKGRRRRFAQDVEGTPFARLLKESVTEIRLEPDEPGQTRVTIELAQRLRGVSRLGGFMFTRAGRRTLDEALERLEAAVGG